MTISSWLNFGRPVPPGSGSAAGRNFGSGLIQPARSICVSSERFFIYCVNYLFLFMCAFGVLFFPLFYCISCMFYAALCVINNNNNNNCIETNAHIVKLFPPSGRGVNCFWHYRRYKIPRETPSAGALKTRGWVCDFRQKLPFISETVRDGPLIAMER